jgi:transposase InsO family protein
MGKSYKKNVALDSVMGRPAKGVGSGLNPIVLSRIVSLRQQHEGWGATTILTELTVNDGYESEDLPSRRNLANIIKAYGTPAIRHTHQPLSSDAPRAVQTAHECWQMDDKGIDHYKGVGYIGTINIKDVFSGVYTQSLGLLFAHKRGHTSLTDYQYALRLAFCEFGTPQRIQADHGSNFYENHTRSPYPTPLHLWLLGLGIELTWARVYRPTDQAKVERTHQIMHNQVRQKDDFRDLAAFQEQLNLRRSRLNYHIPCERTDKPPLVAFPDARHSGRQYNPLREKDLFDTQHIKAYLHQKVWYRKVSKNNTFSLGGQVYYVTKVAPQKELKICFDMNEDKLMLYNDKELVDKISLKGISWENLIEPNFINMFKNRQLKLPFPC